MTGLANMILFLLLTNYLGAIIGVQLFRGDVSEDVNMNFSQAFIAFLGMYQVGHFARFLNLSNAQPSMSGFIVGELD